MVLYQFLQAVLKPYKGFKSFRATLSSSAPRGSLEYASRSKGPDLRKAREESITLKFYFRYAITAKHNRTICNCTIGADAFGSANSRNPFTQHLAANFRFSPTQAPVFFYGRPKSGYFIAYENPPSIIYPHPGSPKRNRIKAPCFPIASISTFLAASPYLL